MTDDTHEYDTIDDGEHRRVEMTPEEAAEDLPDTPSFDDQTATLPRVMVDIETLGRDPGAVICSIGAVRFDTGRLGDTFHESIARESCEAVGLTADPETEAWWDDQTDDAKAVLTGGEQLDIVLEAFAAWFDGADEVWANSPAFDCALLEAAYAAVGEEAPWAFWEERDYRTLSKEVPLPDDIEHDGVAHDALDDAKHQAHVAAATLEWLEGVREDA